MTAMAISEVQREIASTVGWIDIGRDGPACLFCGEPAQWVKSQGIIWTFKCQPCETTWKERWL